MKRVFVGVKLPEDITRSLETLQAGLPGVRLISPENIHLTLRFVGSINEPQLRDLECILSKLEFDEFFLKLGRVGVFPLRGAPQVIWVGVTPNRSLVRLQALIENKCRSIGLKADSRNYHPHVTLGRVKYRRQNQISNWLDNYRMFKSEDFLMSDFSLFQSILNSSGSIYNCISNYKLAINHEFNDFGGEDDL